MTHAGQVSYHLQRVTSGARVSESGRESMRASERYALSCERERERERELVLTRERGRKPVREIERARAREREPARACARTGDGAIVVNSFFQN